MYAIGFRMQLCADRSSLCAVQGYIPLVNLVVRTNGDDDTGRILQQGIPAEFLVIVFTSTLPYCDQPFLAFWAGWKQKVEMCIRMLQRESPLVQHAWHFVQQTSATAQLIPQRSVVYITRESRMQVQ